MSVTDDIVMPTSDSFWELGKFMKTVKRCDNGYKLCDSLRQLVEQRSEIEKKYAKELVQWSKKWNHFLDNGPEYGTTQGAWRGMLCEADSLSELHTLMAEKLMSDAYQSIKFWQKENYHKSMMHFKETKEFEDSFRKAQKPWGKKLTKVLNARKDYHNACRQEKSTTNQENNARADTAVSPDQCEERFDLVTDKNDNMSGHREELKKLQEKLRKLQEDVNTTRDKYQASLNDLNSYNAKYMEDMTEVYEKCQSFEKLRIDFFKKTLFQIHSCLDLSVEARYAKIYTDLHSTVGNTEPDKDLKWWSTNNGVDMAMNWPAFEEYSPELQSISKRGKSQIGGGDGITITRIRHNRESSYENYGSDHAPPPTYNSAVAATIATTTTSNSSSKSQPQSANTHSTSAKHASRQPSYDESLNPFGSDGSGDDGDNNSTEDGDPKLEEEDPVTGEMIKEDLILGVCQSPDVTANHLDPPRVSRVKIKNISTATDDFNGGGASNPFCEAVSDDEQSMEEDPATTRGVAVKAIYDYVKTEDDEFSFKAGDVFVKLSEEDEMGWCKGRKDGDIGLFPANYVVPL